MEARASFGKTGISKLFVGVVLVIVAVGLGIMAAYLASNLTGSAGATQTNSAPGSVMRHDNGRELDQAPAVEQAPDTAPTAPDYVRLRGGIQE
jgi:hypothetical protein